MIRRSTIIALVAVAVSLLFHAFGLSFSGGVAPSGTTEDTSTDVIAVNNAFEDVAEPVPDPETPEPAETPEPEPTPEPELELEPEPEPEPAPEPEPEPEEVPEPETAEAPTTEVLVASSNPQDTNIPDTGDTPVARPDAAGPSALDSGTVPEPQTVQPSGGDDGATSDAAVTAPADPDPVSEPAEGTPEGADEPAEATETATPTPAPTPVPVPSAEQLAVLPSPVAPVAPIAPAVPVAPVPEPSAVPVIPLAPELVAPETPEVAEAPESSETVEDVDTQEADDQPLVASLRPQLPTRRPTPPPEGQPDGAAEAETRTTRPGLIESPLRAYQRDGTDLTIPRRGGTASGGSGSQNFRGNGNSDVTNYMGRVFVHLNRAPAIRVAGRGYVRVFFEINPDGTVPRIDIIESSGSADIERAAKAQIRAAEPLPRPPDGNVRRMSLYYTPN